MGLAALTRIRLIGALHSPTAPWDTASGWHRFPGARRGNTTKRRARVPRGLGEPRIALYGPPLSRFHPHMWTFLWITLILPAQGCLRSHGFMCWCNPQPRFSRIEGVCSSTGPPRPVSGHSPLVASRAR
jgi:hypothetical protein